MKKPKSIIFGASEGGRNILINHSNTHCIVGFTDNNPKKHQGTFMNLPLIAPTYLKDIEIDEVIIASSAGPQIHRQLIEDLKLPNSIKITRASFELISTNWRRETLAFAISAITLICFFTVIAVSLSIII